jgi:integrase/recombinase XerD
MDAVATVRISGPLTRYVEGFAAELRAQGYSELSLANQLRLMADLSRWLQEAEIPVREIDHDDVTRFLAKRRRTHTQFMTERALAPLLRHLGDAGAVSVVAPDRRPQREPLREYERYLVEERAVLPARQALCLGIAAEFLDGKRVDSIKAKDVTRFVDACAGRPGLPGVLSALRSVLQFLFVTSRMTLNLSYAVPAVPRWKLTSLPKFLDPNELEAVLATCDRRTVVGCRGYAVLLLLGRLGLRACEVSALQLEDVDWTAGEIVVRGKGRSLSRLPLPLDIGEAIVAYLRRATRSKTTRAVFVRCRAPYDAAQVGAIIAIAKTALRTAGVSGGAHRLRHTAATQMLRRGASLTEIAQVLRHRHIDTTAIYAKVERDSLRSVAKAWPVEVVDRGRLRDLAPVWPGGAR